MPDRFSIELTPAQFEAVSLTFQIKQHLARLGVLSRTPGDSGWWWPPTPFNRLTATELRGFVILAQAFPQIKSMSEFMGRNDAMDLAARLGVDEPGGPKPGP